jgi:hypothetical protein
MTSVEQSSSMLEVGLQHHSEKIYCYETMEEVKTQRDL